MVRDNSPEERQKRQLARKLARRASYDRILIVSEGSRTEPNYFREIRKAFRLHTANVQVQPSDLGSVAQRSITHGTVIRKKLPMKMTPKMVPSFQ
jgi:hypothetical protein